jgi:NitT/TauT family transport system substrate-binding protein
LAGSETEWQRLAANLRLSDANAVAIYRQRYSEGVLRRSLSEEEADARALYLVLADIGGTQLVGAARALPPGTFYRPAAE